MKKTPPRGRIGRVVGTPMVYPRKPHRSTFRLTDELFGDLVKAERRCGRSRSEILCLALDQGLAARSIGRSHFNRAARDTVA